jgi:hypothetical protein
MREYETEREVEIEGKGERWGREEQIGRKGDRKKGDRGAREGGRKR